MSIKKNIIATSTAMLCAVSTTLYAEGASLEVTGLVEAELGFIDADDGAGTSTSTSDAVLATVELGFDAKLSDKVSAHVLLLHEEDDTDLEVDEGTITVGDENGISVTAGQMYVPFGAFETNVVSDPLTLELAETRESVVMFTAVAGDISASLYLFNGDTSEVNATDDKLENMGFTVSYSKDDFNIGFDYISSMGDSDTLQELFNPSATLPGNVEMKSYVAGIALHAQYTKGDFNVIFEHIAAQDAFETTDFVTAPSKKKEPSATNIDFGYSMGEHNFGLAIQSTDDAGGVLNESGTLISYSRELFEKSTLSVEYAKYDDYGTTDDGTGGSETVITAQLAVEF